MAILAIDFDGTLCEENYPDIGRPNLNLIRFLRKCMARGDHLILYTMREGKDLEEAVEWCSQFGLSFEAINDNLPMMKSKFHNNPRKVYADYYIDDHNAICGIGRKIK